VGASSFSSSEWYGNNDITLEVFLVEGVEKFARPPNRWPARRQHIFENLSDDGSPLTKHKKEKSDRIDEYGLHIQPSSNKSVQVN